MITRTQAGTLKNLPQSRKNGGVNRRIHDHSHARGDRSYPHTVWIKELYARLGRLNVPVVLHTSTDLNSDEQLVARDLGQQGWEIVGSRVKTQRRPGWVYVLMDPLAKKCYVGATVQRCEFVG